MRYMNKVQASKVQKLLWAPEGTLARAFVPQVPPILYPYKVDPTRLWSLYRHQDQHQPPALPFTPVHNGNAFLEDKLHDWNIRAGNLIYRSRVSEGGHWLLLEFETEPEVK